jgi:hypothetical protein
MKKSVPVESASALIDQLIAKLPDWRGQMLAKVRGASGSQQHHTSPKLTSGPE